VGYSELSVVAVHEVWTVGVHRGQIGIRREEEEVEAHLIEGRGCLTLFIVNSGRFRLHARSRVAACESVRALFCAELALLARSVV